MRELTDHELLTTFRATKDRDALGELARRYAGLVFASAFRQVRDRHLAEDITQAVFIVLVRKAHTIHDDAVLPSWFFSVARHAVCNARRMQTRARHHENLKAIMTKTVCAPVELADDEHQLIDEALARLNETDRAGVMMHYFQNRTHREIGRQLGLSEEASRKRVGRALDKMREFLMGRGVSASTLSIAATLPALSGATMSEAFIHSVANVATLSQSAGSGAVTIAQGVTHMLKMAKIKLALAACAALTVTGGIITPVVLQARSTPSISAPVQVMTTTLVNADGKKSDNQFETKVGDRVTIKFLGVAPFGGDADSWFDLSGKPMTAPDGAEQGHIMGNPMPSYQLMFEVEKPEGAGIQPRILHANIVANQQRDEDQGKGIYMCAFGFSGDQKSASMEIGVAMQDWQTIATNSKPEQGGDFETKDYGPISFLPMDTEDGLARVVIQSQQMEIPCQTFAVDPDGKEHRCTNINVQSNGETVSTTLKFDLPANKIQKLVTKVRKFDKVVHVEEFSLEKGHETKPKITVSDAPKETK